MKTQPRGFTLIELIVVVLIIGILAAIALIGYNGFTNKARCVAATASIANIGKALITDQINNQLTTGPLDTDTYRAANLTNLEIVGTPGNQILQADSEVGALTYNLQNNQITAECQGDTNANGPGNNETPPPSNEYDPDPELEEFVAAMNTAIYGQFAGDTLEYLENDLQRLQNPNYPALPPVDVSKITNITWTHKIAELGNTGTMLPAADYIYVGKDWGSGGWGNLFNIGNSSLSPHDVELYDWSLQPGIDHPTELEYCVSFRRVGTNSIYRATSAPDPNTGINPYQKNPNYDLENEFEDYGYVLPNYYVTNGSIPGWSELGTCN